MAPPVARIVGLALYLLLVCRASGAAGSLRDEASLLQVQIQAATEAKVDSNATGDPCEEGREQLPLVQVSAPHEGLWSEELLGDDANSQIAAGVADWTHEGQGLARELREALLPLDSMKFLQKVAEVCGSAPQRSQRECGLNTARRLSCPILMRAATALIPAETLEEEAMRSHQLSLRALARSSGSTCVNRSTKLDVKARGALKLGIAPVTVKACLQQSHNKQLADMFGRLLAMPSVDAEIKQACIGRLSNGTDSACLDAERLTHSCRTVEQAALSIAGPVDLSKQMVFILATHPIMIGQGRFDIVDDPCQTTGMIVLSIVKKFFMGVAFMLMMYCCLATFCCALWKL